jgi:hypothetical protein
MSTCKGTLHVATVRVQDVSNVENRQECPRERSGKGALDSDAMCWTYLRIYEFDASSGYKRRRTRRILGRSVSLIAYVKGP